MNIKYWIDRIKIPLIGISIGIIIFVVFSLGFGLFIDQIKTERRNFMISCNNAGYTQEQCDFEWLKLYQR